MSARLLSVFVLLVNVAIPLASFVTGLRSTDPLWLWKRPRLLGRALLSILVVVPILTVILVEVLSPGNVYVRAGIVVSILSIGIGPPDLLKRTHVGVSTARYEVGLDVVLLAIAIVYMPVAVAIHGAAFQHDVRLYWLDVVRVVLTQALVPFVAGLGVARLFPKIVAPICRHGQRFITAVMLLLVVAALAVAWRALLWLGLAGWLTCAAIAAVAILSGHLLGGPRPETRAALAAFSAIRFPGLALLLVAAVPGGKVLIPVVLAYVIASAILVAVYRAAVVKDVAAEEAHHGEATQTR